MAGNTNLPCVLQSSTAAQIRKLSSEEGNANLFLLMIGDDGKNIFVQQGHFPLNFSGLSPLPSNRTSRLFQTTPATAKSGVGKEQLAEGGSTLPAFTFLCQEQSSRESTQKRSGPVGRKGRWRGNLFQHKQCFFLFLKSFSIIAHSPLTFKRKQ